MKIALAQLNPLIGDLAGNARKILLAAEKAAQQGADLVVTSELSLIGYPPKDLLLRPELIQANLQCLQWLAERSPTSLLVGFVEPNPQERGRHLRNSVALLYGGRVHAVRHKSLLPTYDVFDESRYFEPALRVDPIEFAGHRLGLSICEDLWNEPLPSGRLLYHRDPICDLVSAGASVILNCSASPFVVGKHRFRCKLFGRQARRFGVPILYCNQVGGQDELVFDGASCVFDAQGRLAAQARCFAEDLLLVDIAPPAVEVVSAGVSLFGDRKDAGKMQHPHDRQEACPTETDAISQDLGDMYDALVLGTRDYVTKCGFKEAVVGLSGGIDSALVATIAADALGPKNVWGVAMPSRYSSEHSVEDARKIAENLGIRFEIVPIADIHAAYEKSLAEVFLGQAPGLAEENVQSRARGAILMAISNKFGSLLLTTGNKSEIAVGYCTLYGDMCGGLAVISDVPKTVVYGLADCVNQRATAAGRTPPIPPGSMTKAPSAELKPDQTDQDSLPPYVLLDAVIERYVELERSTEEIIAELVQGQPFMSQSRPAVEEDAPPDTLPHRSALQMVDAAILTAVGGQGTSQLFTEEMIRGVIRKIDLSEYKRRQAAPGLKVTSRAFGFGRRMPIACCHRVQVP